MRLPFVQLVMEVEKVYSKSVEEKEYEFQSQVVSSLITSSGWTEDEYWAAWMSLQRALTN